MRIFLSLFFLMFFTVTKAFAHGDHGGERHSHEAIPASVENARVEIIDNGDFLVLKGNGLPPHETGDFPNRRNPHAIAPQDYDFRILKLPEFLQEPQRLGRNNFGIAVNGIPFDPATAECYGRMPTDPPAGPNCEWNEEAVVGKRGLLGLDFNMAHVQPGGAYHYHGKAKGLMEQFSGNGPHHIGYAADGIKIYAYKNDVLKPSHQLRIGQRRRGPMGEYDGTYTQDFEFVEGSGDLDICNGADIEGEYVYFITDSFPFIPRCWKAKPDDSFIKKRDRNGWLLHNSPEGRLKRPSHHRP